MRLLLARWPHACRICSPTSRRADQESAALCFSIFVIDTGFGLRITDFGKSPASALPRRRSGRLLFGGAFDLDLYLFASCYWVTTHIPTAIFPYPSGIYPRRSFAGEWRVTSSADLGVEVPLQIDRVTFQPLRHQSLPRRPYYTTQMHQNRLKMVVEIPTPTAVSAA